MPDFKPSEDILSLSEFRTTLADCVARTRDTHRLSGLSLLTLLRGGVAFGRIFGVGAKDMTVCDIELLNGRARQKAASSVAHCTIPRI